MRIFIIRESTWKWSDRNRLREVRALALSLEGQIGLRETEGSGAFQVGRTAWKWLKGGNKLGLRAGPKNCTI